MESVCTRRSSRASTSASTSVTSPQDMAEEIEAQVASLSDESGVEAYVESEPPTEDEYAPQSKKGGRRKPRASTSKRVTKKDKDKVEEGDNMSIEASPKSKRARVSTTKPKKVGRLGRLAAVLEMMPLEILSEILSHLNPAMLLRLARMAKVFRKLLMSRESSAIWRAAFNNDGIGEFQADDMAYPKIAALIWDKECNECGRLKVHKICYALRERICETCYKNFLTNTVHIPMKIQNLHPYTLECVPGTRNSPSRSIDLHRFNPGRYNGERWYMDPALRKMSDHLYKLQALDPAQFIKDPQDATATRPDHAQIGESETSTQNNNRNGDDADDSSSSASVSESDYVVPVHPAVQKFVEAQRVLLAKAEKDAEMLQKWQEEHDRARVSKKSDLRHIRHDAIVDRCVDAGYTPSEVLPAIRQGSSVWKHVDQPYELTERVWRKIERPILQACEEERQLRLEREAARQEAERLRMIEAEKRLQALLELKRQELTRQKSMGEWVKQIQIDMEGDDIAKQELPQMRSQFMSSVFALKRFAAMAAITGRFSLTGTFMSSANNRPAAQSLRVLMARARAAWLAAPDNVATQQQIETAAVELSQLYGPGDSLITAGQMKEVRITLDWVSRILGIEPEAESSDEEDYDEYGGVLSEEDFW